ncbi:unnamed protein product [Rotaria magnacalcarata]
MKSLLVKDDLRFCTYRAKIEGGFLNPTLIGQFFQGPEFKDFLNKMNENSKELKNIIKSIKRVRLGPDGF